jgi:hypothetical protein
MIFDNLNNLLLRRWNGLNSELLGILKSYGIGISRNFKLKTYKIFIFICDILRDMQIKKEEEDSKSQLRGCIVRNTSISASANSRYQALQKYLKSTCVQHNNIVTDWGMKQGTTVCVQGWATRWATEKSLSIPDWGKIFLVKVPVLFGPTQLPLH